MQVGSKMITKLKTAINSLRGLLSGASRSHYRKRTLDQNRAEGDRPYQGFSDEEVKAQYVSAIGRVRDANKEEAHLFPIIDRGWHLSKEWEPRGNDSEELNQALRDAGYEVEK
jgi:hypothetical protein